MQSTFSGIEIGKRSLNAHNRALTTAGHNLSNASVRGYSRQRVQMEATHPIYRPQLNRAERPGQVGQGVQVARVERLKDMILEGRIVSQANGEGYWQSRDKYVMMLEQVYNEPTNLSVRSLMDQFWDGWQELAMLPEQGASRAAVVRNGEALIEGIHQRSRSLHELREMLDDEIRATVRDVNVLIRDIADINMEIVKSEAAGDNPNDLLDRRDVLVEDLSKLINITTDTRDPDEFNIHTSGFHIVQGGISRPFELEAEPANEGFSRVRWSHSDETADFRGGKLFALQELRDSDVREELQKLDTMTITFIDLVNEIHRDGYGLDGASGNDFFVEHQAVINALGNYDSTGDGAFDSTYLHRINGANRLQNEQQIGLSGVITLPSADGTVDVQYNPTDTVGDLIARINNSGAEVTARLNREDRLQLRATPAEALENPDFVIRSLQDSGQFLVGYSGVLLASGAAGAFSSDAADQVTALRADADFSVAPLARPSSWIEVTETLRRDPSKVAASFGEAGRPGEAGNGMAAREIASLRNNPVMVGRTATFDDYFADSVAEIGLKGKEARIALETQQLIMKDLREMRESISGVNIDEELADMIRFQHGYNAAARYIAQVDQMLDVIINRMGV
ncbi:MAG: flagellar hook-associated protein FlgK [Spirochaetaceae bacterium]|nr:MAG: flagellar hook-associated protein FlgK [Spirochaetaceae bacterium]